LDKHFKEDCRNDTTVEDMLIHIRALRVVAGGSMVRDLSADDFRQSRYVRYQCFLAIFDSHRHRAASAQK
jgi:hypothetical protein